jgi:molecular chaperone GrpE
MSEPPPPGVAEGAAVGDRPAQGLSPGEVDAVLAEFRSWLASLPAGAPDGFEPGGPPEVDLHTLVGQFTALRHEVNLQTRAARAQQEQSAEAVRALQQALDALKESARGEEAGEEERLRPLLRTLVETYDALALAARAAERGQEVVLPLLGETAGALGQAESAPRPWWGRLFGGGKSEAARERARRGRQACERAAEVLGSLLAGYRMSLERVDRALRGHGLEPIPAAGQAFDPERMEVLEAVAGSGRPSGEVLEEVRRGYLWNGRVFRYAQVRVARS